MYWGSEIVYVTYEQVKKIKGFSIEITNAFKNY